jgi:hypothetical protein
MSQHYTYKLIRAVCIGLGFLSATTLAILTVVAEKTDITSAMAVAMPGIICHLLITGGHGGTRAEEVAGFTVAIIVNASLGAGFFAFAFVVFRHLDRKTNTGKAQAN